MHSVGSGGGTLQGGSGYNLLDSSGSGSSVLYGGSGTNDLETYFGGTSTLYGGAGTNNSLYAGSGSSQLYDGGGNNALYGGSGATTLLYANGGNNTLYDQGGANTLSVPSFATGGANTLVGTGGGYNTLAIHSGSTSLSLTGITSSGYSSYSLSNTTTGPQTLDVNADGAGNVNFGLAASTAFQGYSGALTIGAGSNVGVIKDGAGNQVISGSNNYSGPTIVNAGTLTLANGAGLGGTAITVNSGATFSAGSGTSGGSASSGVPILTLNPGSALTIAGGNTQELFINGLSGQTAPPLTIDGAALSFELKSSGADQLADTAAANVSGVNTINITPVGTSLTTGTYTLISAASGLSGDFAFANGATAEAVTVGNQSYALILQNTDTAETLTVVNAVYWTGATNGNWDTSTANWANASGGTTTTTYAAGEAVVFDDNAATTAVTVAANVAPAAIIFNNSVQSYTVSNNSGVAISGASLGVWDEGGGSVTISGSNSLSGLTSVVLGSTLQLGDGTNNGAVGGNIDDEGTLEFANGSAQTYTGVISGAGDVSISGPAALTLSGTNTLSGQTTIDAAAMLVAGANNCLSPNSTIALNGTLDLNGYSESAPSITGNGIVTNDATSASATSTLTVGADDSDGEFDGVIKDGSHNAAVALMKTGNGTLTLGGANTYSAGTTIASGSLQVGGGGSFFGNVIDNGTLVFANATSMTYSGTITGSGGVIVAGPGTLTLAGQSSYGGATTVSGGQLNVTGSIVSPVTIEQDATLSGTGTTGPAVSEGGTYAANLYQLQILDSVLQNEYGDAPGDVTLSYTNVPQVLGLNPADAAGHGFHVNNSSDLFLYTANYWLNGTDVGQALVDSGSGAGSGGSSGSGIGTGKYFPVALALNTNGPQANDDAYEDGIGGSLSVGSAHGILANDNTKPGAPLTVKELDCRTSPGTITSSEGSLTWFADGSFLFTPSSTFVGAYQFNYIATDGPNDTNLATATINVELPSVGLLDDANNDGLVNSADEAAKQAGMPKIILADDGSTDWIAWGDRNHLAEVDIDFGVTSDFFGDLPTNMTGWTLALESTNLPPGPITIPDPAATGTKIWSDPRKTTELDQNGNVIWNDPNTTGAVPLTVWVADAVPGTETLTLELMAPNGKIVAQDRVKIKALRMAVSTPGSPLSVPNSEFTDDHGNTRTVGVYTVPVFTITGDRTGTQDSDWRLHVSGNGQGIHVLQFVKVTVHDNTTHLDVPAGTARQLTASLWTRLGEPVVDTFVSETDVPPYYDGTAGGQAPQASDQNGFDIGDAPQLGTPTLLVLNPPIAGAYTVTWTFDDLIVDASKGLPTLVDWINYAESITYTPIGRGEYQSEGAIVTIIANHPDPSILALPENVQTASLLRGYSDAAAQNAVRVQTPLFLDVFGNSSG